ncbi:MAG: hypothetical protein SH819_14825 [Cytophagales bacterium]|nr:hypothetical protein [Cytophagales bacterium]
MKIYTSLLVLLCLSCAQPTPKESNSSDQAAPAEKVTPVEAAAAQSSSETLEPMVYATASGDKYHTADCRYSKTAQPIKLAQAKADGKTACDVCKPSSTTGEKQIRCAGITAEGKQCQRMTTDAGGKCFQHRGA